MDPAMYPTGRDAAVKTAMSRRSVMLKLATGVYARAGDGGWGEGEVGERGLCVCVGEFGCDREGCAGRKEKPQSPIFFLERWGNLGWEKKK